MIFLHFIRHPKRGKLPIKKGEVNGNKKSENSSKSNKIPSENSILKLEKRNKNLYNKMKEIGINNKYFKELELSINKDYVKEFWYGCKG